MVPYNDSDGVNGVDSGSGNYRLHSLGTGSLVMGKSGCRQVRLVVKRDEQLQGSKHFYVNCEREEWKLDTLCDLMATLPHSQCIICIARYVLPL